MVYTTRSSLFIKSYCAVVHCMSLHVPLLLQERVARSRDRRAYHGGSRLEYAKCPDQGLVELWLAFMLIAPDHQINPLGNHAPTHTALLPTAMALFCAGLTR